MKKKGLSHIEVVLGFLIFLVAIMFIIASYQPLFEKKSFDNNLINRLYENFLKNTSVEVREYYTLINSDEVTGIKLDEDMTVYGFTAIDSKGNKIDLGKTDSGVLCLDARENYNKEIVKIILSESITNNPYSCLEVPEKYKITTMLETNYIDMHKIERFDQVYKTNKRALINSLELPDSINFEYTINIEGREFLGKSDEEINRNNVFTTQRKLKVIDENGNLLEGEFEFKIW